MNRRYLKKALAVIISVLTMCMISLPAAASSREVHAAKQPDYTRTGSVTLDIREADGTVVPGGSLIIIPVADAVYEDGNNLFVYREEFAECGLDIARIEEEDNGAHELALELAAWASEKGIEGTEKEIDEQGHVQFEELPLGLYLFIQKTPAESYECLHPFLVTVPIWDGEKLVYDVDASPKPGTAMGLSFVEIPLEKVFKATKGDLPKGETFTFRMIPAKADYPMSAPEGGVTDPETGSVTLVHGAGKFSFGKIWFGEEDAGKSYLYKIGEIAGKNSRITYDKTIYTLKIDVVKNEETGKIECTLAIKDNSGKIVTEIVFTNTYEPPSTPPGTPGKPGKPNLPKTGQLWWPVPLLAAAGLLLFAAGRIRSRGKKQS